MGWWLSTYLWHARQTSIIHPPLTYLCMLHQQQWPLMYSQKSADNYILIHQKAFTWISVMIEKTLMYYEVRPIRNGQDFAALDFLFTGITSIEGMERALIFSNWVEDSQLGWQRLRELLPTHLWSYVGFLHSRRAEGAKIDELAKYKRGETRILWLTEIGAMVHLSLFACWDDLSWYKYFPRV